MTLLETIQPPFRESQRKFLVIAQVHVGAILQPLGFDLQDLTVEQHTVVVNLANPLVKGFLETLRGGLAVSFYVCR